MTCKGESEHKEKVTIEEFPDFGIISESKLLTSPLAKLTPDMNADNKQLVVGVEKCVLKKVKEDESTTAPDEDPKE